MPKIHVKGMTCSHCIAAVTKALEGLPGVSNVQVDLDSGQVSYDNSAPIPREDLERAIKTAGFGLMRL